jgi:hypothetical protein
MILPHSADSPHSLNLKTRVKSTNWRILIL